MRPKCVLIYLILSAMSFFLFSARKPIAAEYAADTPGCLTAVGKTGKPLGPCPLVHTAVQAEISGVLARVTVRQEFQNVFREPIEAVYAFPLPHRAPRNHGDSHHRQDGHPIPAPSPARWQHLPAGSAYPIHR